MGVPLVAVTMAPLKAKLQPAPAPLTNVRPAGSVSVTATEPVLAAVPRFVTTKV